MITHTVFVIIRIMFLVKDVLNLDLKLRSIGFIDRQVLDLDLFSGKSLICS